MDNRRWSRVQELYAAASERPERERARFLSDACQGDKTLEREVQELLEQTVSTAKFIEFVGGAPAAPRHEAEDLSGRQLGTYTLVSFLGRGGMGEVYRARDSRLGRDVAIKLLPARFTEDAGRLARFESEARALAALNHPHIGAIYGMEDAGGVPALVLELVDGETLADRLRRGALAPVEALPLARQIADALDAAHRKGIVHRDLKPANIKITSDGGVKVLDFGLAKAIRADVEAAEGLSQSPTTPAAATHVGIIVGTAAYMSPEQARGLPVDTRTDIWAFGCVLFEMLTGQSPFGGETVSETLSAIFEREPVWSRLPSSTPAAIRELLRGCLQKEVAARYAQFSEVRDRLDRVITGRNRWKTAAMVTAAAALVAVVAIALIARRSGSASPIVSSSDYQQLTDLTESAVAPSLSPDGRMVAFKVGENFFLGAGQIYVKVLPNGESVALTRDPAPKYGPVFTPDGSKVAYSSVGVDGWQTFTVPVLGGEPARLLPNASGLTYLPDGRVLFAEVRGGMHMGIVSAQLNRGEPRDVYFPPHQLGMAHFAQSSPDRTAVLVVEMDQTHAFGRPCRLVPSDGSSPGRTVGPNGTCTAAAWSPDGRWMFFSAMVNGRSHLWRQRYPDGEPEQLTAGPTEEEGVAVAPDGRSLLTALGLRRSSIWIHDRSGERSVVSEGYAKSPQWSADGRRLFFLLRASGEQEDYELRAMNLPAGTVETIVPATTIVDYDVSNDGAQILFSKRENDQTQIWITPSDRRQPPRLLATGADQMSFLPDNDVIARSVEGSANTLVRISADGARRQQVESPQVHEKGQMSADGRWAIVYSPGTGTTDPSKTFAVALNGGAARLLCMPYCDVGWSSDGRFFTIGVHLDLASGEPAQTLVVPVSEPWALPEVTGAVHAIFDYAAVAQRRGVLTLPHGRAIVGPDPETYVFTKTEFHTNLFRIPLKN